MLADLETMGVDQVLCLGDVVGYGADPQLVVDSVSRLATAVVAGNHDHAVAGRVDLGWFNAVARRAAEWTAGELGADQTGYLDGLPLVATVSEATLVHSSPRNPADWPYLVAPVDGALAFSAFTTSLCFVGHSHVPAVWALREDGRFDFRRGTGVTDLVPEQRYLVNVGSVGQPRDGDADAGYALWDLEARTVEIRRVPYDTLEARRRIHAAGLPRILGDRLLAGR